MVWFSYHFVLGPALLYKLGYGLLHQTLQSFSCIVTALVKLRTKKNFLRTLLQRKMHEQLLKQGNLYS